MTPIKLQTILGVILLIVGVSFDFFFVQGKISEAFKTNSVSYLSSWEKQLYDLTKFYMIVLGFANIVLALLAVHLASSEKIDWTILGLMFIGSIIVIMTGFWYAIAGPSFKWEVRCTVLTAGLFAVLLALGLEIHKLIFTRSL